VRKLWSLIAGILALVSTRPQATASTDQVKNEPSAGPTEIRQNVTLTCGDVVDRKAFEHKQKIRAWFRAHGLWANEPDTRPRIWIGK
jgi:hypothetical protein